MIVLIDMKFGLIIFLIIISTFLNLKLSRYIIRENKIKQFGFGIVHIGMSYIKYKL